MDKKAIGTRIKQYREESGMTQEILEEKVNLSTGYISAVERGVGLPSVETLINIINNIGASADQIFTDVIDTAYETRASMLSDRIKGLPTKEQRRILNVVETMVRDAQNDVE